MHIDFTQRDLVRKWADFSGDFNPIHFDRSAAARVGSSELVTHGMLMLLPIKQALAQSLARAPFADAPYSQFKSYFRHPVPQESAPELRIVPARDRLNFSLLSDGAACFRGSYAPVSSVDWASRPDLPAPCGGHIDAAEMAHSREVFLHSFPSIAEDWIFLDALVFSHFLQAMFRRFELPSATRLAVQTNHHVEFDREAVRQLLADGMPADGLRYGWTETTVGEEAGHHVGCAAIEVRAGHRLVMCIEVGLSMRQVH